MSFILLFGAVQGTVATAALIGRRERRPANAFLAGLILLLTLKLVPYIIGYAGFYMAYPWLDLAPFDMGLGVGPVLYLYVCSLTAMALPPKWKLHLLPLAAQFLVYLALFLQPMGFKNRFEDLVGPTFNRVENVLVMFSLSFYIWLTWRQYFAFESRMKIQVGGPNARSLRYLRSMLIVFSTTLIAFVGAKLWTVLIHELSYFQMFPFYVLLTVAVYLFGFVTFQFSELTFPVLGEAFTAKETDWAEVAAEYSEQLRGLTFWKDQLLSISTAAQALGTSEYRLSRAINSGLGITFSEWINRHRVNAVAICLADSTDNRTVQELALECGFNSKASFHRWFRTVQGCTATDFRARARKSEEPFEEPRPVSR